MGKDKKITPVQQYNIDIIRKYRLGLNISATELSIGINRNPTYIGHIESLQSDFFYSDQVMNDVANYLTLAAQERQDNLKSKGIKKKIKTEYTIHDFYPMKPLPDVKQLKTIDPIPKGSGPSVTLNAIIETDSFFDVPRRLKEIVSYCNELQNQQWKGNDFTQTLDRALRKGRLERVPLEGDFVAYVKPKKEKKE